MKFAKDGGRSQVAQSFSLPLRIHLREGFQKLIPGVK